MKVRQAGRNGYRKSLYALLIPTDPTPQARHQTLGIPLILAILPILVAGQINLFRQWRPATHPHVDLLRIEVAGQRLQPVDVVAIHDPWLGVEARRDGLGELAVLARVICPTAD